MKFVYVLQGLALFVGLGGASPTKRPGSRLVQRKVCKKPPSCNTPTDRACWTTNGFNISTDYETSTPNTGVTRKYNFVVTEHVNWTGGDGEIKDLAMLVNGQFPGPVVMADWGDTVQVTVTNNLITNGTSFHWHGVRMLDNNVNDGVNGVTECPIPPGHSKIYTFRAEQYGTSWYHSHHGIQYGNGVLGSIQINGPASANYDIDLGVFPIADWYYGSADDIADSLLPSGTIPPPSDNVLFNGTGVSVNGKGEYYRVQLTPGKSHLLRIVNPSVENHFQLSLVGHQLTVVTTDFVAVEPYTTSSLFVAVGQRYDVIINATQEIGNYWFNATFSPTGGCGACNTPNPAAIFHYAGASDDLPTDQGVTPTDSGCQDYTDYTPVVTRTAPEAAFSASSANELQVSLEPRPWNGFDRTYWTINGQDMNITWGKPTLQYVAEGNISSIPISYNIYQVPVANTWAFWIIQNGNLLFNIPHPLHLHGHDFLILGQGQGVFDETTAVLNFENPTRRDVTMLPGSGWVAVAFYTDNPGSWLFHCHIAWHVSEGLSVQFLERAQDIPADVQLSDITNNCNNWNNYYPADDPYTKDDSGLKVRHRPLPVVLNVPQPRQTG